MLKHLALSALSKPSVARLLRPLGRARAIVVMFHRFASERGTSHGHDARSLADTLTSLRAIGARFVHLEDIVAFGQEPRRSDNRGPLVAFSVDDGYADFAKVGVPVFDHFRCPVTCFLVPDVVEARRWFWWDILAWISRVSPSFDLDGELVTLSPESVSSIAERLKVLPTGTREALIDDLVSRSGVPIPAERPARFSTLSWDEARELESPLVRFGAHTMSHPILGRCDNERSRVEIVEACRRVRNELRNPSRVFCYPNGMPGDFGPREWDTLRGIDGVDGAVAAYPGAITAEDGLKDPEWRWRIPRFAYDARPGAITRHSLI